MNDGCVNSTAQSFLKHSFTARSPPALGKSLLGLLLGHLFGMPCLLFLVPRLSLGIFHRGFVPPVLRHLSSRRAADAGAASLERFALRPARQSLGVARHVAHAI